jgi:hypothetical protein
LTLLGAGAFGNDQRWILGAMRRALDTVSAFEIDVRIASYGPPSAALLDLVKEFQ